MTVGMSNPLGHFSARSGSHKLECMSHSQLLHRGLGTTNNLLKSARQWLTLFAPPLPLQVESGMRLMIDDAKCRERLLKKVSGAHVL